MECLICSIIRLENKANCTKYFTRPWCSLDEFDLFRTKNLSDFCNQTEILSIFTGKLEVRFTPEVYQL